MDFLTFVNKVAEFEGFSATPYKCPAGQWTIGYGRTEGVTADTPATSMDIEKNWLSDKLDRHIMLISANYSEYDFTFNQVLALADFTYNCGLRNLKKLTADKTRSILQISEAMLLYNKANGKVLDGLVKRRQWEHELFLSDFKGLKVKGVEVESLLAFKINHQWWVHSGKSINLNDTDYTIMWAVEMDVKTNEIFVNEKDVLEVKEIDILNNVYPMQFFCM